MAQNVPFEAVIKALQDDDTPFPARLLERFSDIAPTDLKLLMSAWPGLSVRRKVTLLEDLEDLSESDTLTSFEDLARPLLTDPEADIRIQAIHLLHECEDAKLIPTLLDILEHDESGEAHTAAAGALGLFVYLGELEKIPAETLRTIEDALLAVVDSKQPVELRRKALESLGFSGREEVVKLIEKAYQQKSPEWIASALFAMGRSCDERWKKNVLSQLRSPDEDVRSEAVHAAGELELPSARPILLDLVEDEEDAGVRREIVWALSKLGGEGVRAKIEELLESEEDDEEVEFIEEALDNLAFTEDLGGFDMFGIVPDDDLHEVDPDEPEGE